MLSLLLGMRRPVRTAHELVAWCGRFGVAAGTARVALSRMVKAGELTNHDGRYELAGRMRARRDEQAFALAPRFVDADGAWWLELVVAEQRDAAARAALRTALRHAGYGERRAGVWMRPANLDRPRDPLAVAQCERLRVVPERPVVLAADLFAPGEWAAQARIHRRALRDATRGLAHADGLAPAFVVGAAAVAHLRADPLLPPDLVRGADPGTALRADYVAFRRAFSVAVSEWFASL